MSALIEEHANLAAAGAEAIRLSVLIPFHRDDPSGLIKQLAADAPSGVELVAFDDGAPDAALTERVKTSVQGVETPARLVVARVNFGRSGARNRLAARARGEWLLFLDADMRTEPGFLQRWLDHIAEARADALFGGYAPVAPESPAHKVHAALAHASDVRSAAERETAGPVAICSSNLAVRASAFILFDEGYEGWGWEDVDWALSFAARACTGHVDNPAGHAGLESVEGLIAKFARSGPNFARLLDRHPDYAARPGARLALAVRRFRIGPLARLTGAIAARAGFAPVALRVAGLKLYRAGVAARSLSR
ncbi:MAG: glycosyltransferase family 2 protein [Oceanicaulis sp.]